MPYATYRFNKIIAAETIRFIVTVAIVVYKGLKLVVYRMLTVNSCHAALAVLLVTLSIISTAFAVCIPKKIQRISVFLFLAFILASE